MRKTLEFSGALICFHPGCLYVWMYVCMSENYSSKFEGLFSRFDCVFREFQSESWLSIKPSKNFLKHLFTWKDWISAGGAQKAVFITEDLCLECQKKWKTFWPPKNLHKCSKCIIKQKLDLNSNACISTDVSKLTGIPQEQLNWILVCLDNWVILRLWKDKNGTSVKNCNRDRAKKKKHPLKECIYGI